MHETMTDELSCWRPMHCTFAVVCVRTTFRTKRQTVPDRLCFVPRQRRVTLERLGQQQVLLWIIERL